MKLHVGVHTLEEAECFLSHGADELYCGLSRFRTIRPAAFSSPRQMYRVARMCHSQKKRAFFVLNSRFSPDQYPVLMRMIGGALDHGFDGIILRDLPLIEHLNRRGVKTCFILSVVGMCYNSRTLRFYRDLGIRRVVLQSQQTAAEAGRLLNNPYGIEIEAFLLFVALNMIPICFLPCPNVERPGGMTDYFCRYPYTHRHGRFYTPEPDLNFILANFHDYYRAGVQYMKVPRVLNGPMMLNEFKLCRYIQLLLHKGLAKDQFVREGARVIMESRLNRHGANFRPIPFPVS